MCGNRLMIGVQSSRKVLRRDAHLQRLLPLGPLKWRDQEDNLDLLAEAGRRHLLQPVEVEEEELLGKREVLLQQPVSDERAARIRQQRILSPEPDGPQRRRPAASPAGLREFVARSRITIRSAVVRQQFVQRVDQAALAVQVEAQRSQVQLVERDVRADR